MKHKIETLKKWFEPFLTKKNIILVSLGFITITILILLGVFAVI